MTSAINASYPSAGNATTASVRANFAAAKAEIEALQNAAGTGATLPVAKVIPAVSPLQLVPDANFSSLSNLVRSPGYYYSYDQNSVRSPDPTYSIVDATTLGDGASLFPAGTKALKIVLAAGYSGNNTHYLEFVTRVTADTLAQVSTSPNFEESFWCYVANTDVQAGIVLFNYNSSSNSYAYAQTGSTWGTSNATAHWERFGGNSFASALAASTVGGIAVNLYANSNSADERTLYIVMPSICQMSIALATEVNQALTTVSSLSSVVMTLSDEVTTLAASVKTATTLSSDPTYATAALYYTNNPDQLIIPYTTSMAESSGDVVVVGASSAVTTWSETTDADGNVVVTYASDTTNGTTYAGFLYGFYLTAETQFKYKVNSFTATGPGNLYAKVIAGEAGSYVISSTQVTAGEEVTVTLPIGRVYLGFFGDYIQYGPSALNVQVSVYQNSAWAAVTLENSTSITTAASSSAPVDGNVYSYLNGAYVKLSIPLTTVTDTAYTLILDNAPKSALGQGTVVVNSATACAVTIPTNDSVSFAVGTTLSLIQYGAGTITVAASSGVTLVSASSFTSKAQYSNLTLTKIDTDVWVLSGDMT